MEKALQELFRSYFQHTSVFFSLASEQQSFLTYQFSCSIVGINIVRHFPLPLLP